MLPRKAAIRLLITFIWTVGAFAVCCAAQHAPQPLALVDLGRASLPVETWQFHPGDDMGWAAPGYDDSGWRTIQAGRSWEGQGYRNLTGFGWYRRRIEIPAGGDWTMALYLEHIDSACEVYWNGVKMGGMGRVPPHPIWYRDDLYVPVVISLGKPQSGELAIRVWRAPRFFLSFPEEGGLDSVPRMGSVEAAWGVKAQEQLAWLSGSEATLVVGMLSALVGLLAFLAWMRQKDRRMLMWLALAMVFPLTRAFCIDVPGVLSFRAFYAMIGPDVALHDISVWFLLIALLGLDGRTGLVGWTKVLALAQIPATLPDVVLMFFNWTPARAHAFFVIDVTSTIPAILMEGWGVVLVVAALRQRLSGARWFLAIAALTVDLEQLVSNADLGARWTHLTAQRWLLIRLFSIGVSPVTVDSALQLLFLVAILYAAWRYSAEVNERQTALEHEYRSAQELQHVLIPESLPALAHCSIGSAYRPAQEVGGDFFQVISLAGDSSLVVIGDVSGKGLHAAMTVALIVGAIRSTVEQTDEPAELLVALNRRLHGRLRKGFATCLAVRQEANGRCLVANAGHLPPFLNGKELALPPALPLGIVAAMEYGSTELRLEPGDRLTLYTDGVLEARNAEGELFGFERMRAVSGETAQEIADAAQQFGQEDDITVLTLAFAPGEVAHA